MTITLNPPPIREEIEPAWRNIHARPWGWGIAAIDVVIAVRALKGPPCQKPADGRHCSTAAMTSSAERNHSVKRENFSLNVVGSTKIQMPAIT